MNVDDQGDRHFRYTQTFNGLPVIGGDLVVHVDVKGAIYGVNGTGARRHLAHARLGRRSRRPQRCRASPPTPLRGHDRRARATRSTSQTDDGVCTRRTRRPSTGMRGQDPARDKVYVDLDTGEIVADYPQIHFAESRKVYTASNGTHASRAR